MKQGEHTGATRYGRQHFPAKTLELVRDGVTHFENHGHFAGASSVDLNNCTTTILTFGQWDGSYVSGLPTPPVTFAAACAALLIELRSRGHDVVVWSTHYNPPGDWVTSCPPKDWRNQLLIDQYNTAARCSAHA